MNNAGADLITDRLVLCDDAGHVDGQVEREIVEAIRRGDADLSAPAPTKGAQRRLADAGLLTRSSLGLLYADCWLMGLLLLGSVFAIDGSLPWALFGLACLSLIAVPPIGNVAREPAGTAGRYPNPRGAQPASELLMAYRSAVLAM